MLQVPLQHGHIQAFPSCAVNWFCIFLLDHSEENKRYQARCLLIAQDGQPRALLLVLSMLFTPHSPSLVLSESRFPWHLFSAPQSLCLHTFDRGTAISSLDCLPLSVRAPSYGRTCTKNSGILLTLFWEVNMLLKGKKKSLLWRSSYLVGTSPTFSSQTWHFSSFFSQRVSVSEFSVGEHWIRSWFPPSFFNFTSEQQVFTSHLLSQTPCITIAHAQ